MKAIITIIMAVITLISAHAVKYSYAFNGITISQALKSISKDHPEINISFIYKELDNYKTSARIHTDDILEALQHTIGYNPISVIEKGGNYYIEALQHGKYCYIGRVTGTNDEPVAAATVMLLEPKDSTVVTYGVTDYAGRFSIPCDRKTVIGKFTCIGYVPTYRTFNSFSVGDITMKESPVQLQGVNVDGDNTILHSDRSIYIPTLKQKQSAQSGTDLIIRMAIPQLRMSDELKTASGQPVELYIDYIPANTAELSGMNIDDVKRVEYYDYPTDPRFQGNAHVINFIMQQYEYGGYVKGTYYDNFTASRELIGYARIQYKNMTYDYAGGVYYMNNTHDYEESYETYRLPQTDGSVKEFKRNSEVSASKLRRDNYWSSLKAMYRTDNTTMSNMLTADFYHTPKQYLAGSVNYNPAEFAMSEYTSQNSSRINSFIYNGYWHFTLPHNNSITFNPYYAYSHTNQNTLYEESGFDSYINGARDDSHQASGNLTYAHSFGMSGTLKLMCQGRFLQNSTHYYGTSTNSDKARTYRLGPGINYSFTNEKIHALAGVGLHWDKSTYGNITENSTAPWVVLSLQYAFNNKSSVSADINYSKSIPISNFRSASVVQYNPLMSYTGNPSLVPYNSFQVEGNYTFVPSNRYSLSAFGFAWIVDNRYAYDYEASSTGILRTIKQPMGIYAQWQYGLQASTRQFNKKLHAGVALYIDQAHNGTPYNWTKTKVIFSASAYYYLNNIYFGITYGSPSGYPDGCMVGTWMEPRSIYTFQAGWSNKNWKLRFFTRNFLRHNTTYQTKGTMQSKYYDETRYLYSSGYSVFFQISGTYTFSFGKKVKTDEEAYQATGASSGILK